MDRALTVRGASLLVTFVLGYAVPTAGQTFEQIGSWQYTAAGGTEAIYTESTDADRTFSLEVTCEDGEPNVGLSFLIATSADNIGIDPDRFGPDAKTVDRLDGQDVAGSEWSFSTYSETFVNEKPDPFLTALEGAGRMTIRVREADGTRVGTYHFDLEGSVSALNSLSCYRPGGDESSGRASERPTNL